MPQPDPTTPDRLDGWGEIATHLGRDVRTAQRWEKEQGLPVYRNGGARGRVWAFRSEVDAWWKRDAPVAQEEPPPEPEPKRPSRLPRLSVLAVVAALGALIVAYFVLPRSKPLPAAFVVPDRIFARAEAEGGTVRSVPVRGLPDRLALSPDGRSLYVFDANAPSEVQIIDPDRLSVVQTLAIGPAGSIAFGERGRIVYFGTIKDGLQIMDRDTGRLTVVREGITTRVHDLAMTPDGKRLYVAAQTGGLKRFDVRERRLVTVWTDRCPEYLAMDPAGRFLYVSTGCGPGRSTAHDTIEVMDVRSESTVRTLKGPSMVTPDLAIFPQGDRLWASGLDACLNPAYRPVARDCPEFPGTIDNVFRVSDGSFVSIGRPHAHFLGGPAVITPDGTRAILGGRPPRVLDTTFYQEQEEFGNTRADAAPVLDPYRRRLYLARPDTAGTVYAIDLPASDCDPPPAGRVHFWAGDGTRNDRVNQFPLSMTGEVPYLPGLVGRAFDLANGSLELTTPYYTLFGFTYRDGAIEGWIKIIGTGPGTIADFLKNRKRVWTLGIGADRRPVFEVSGSPALISNTQLEPKAWHHFALVRQDRDARLYVDGVSVLKFAGINPGEEGDSTLRLGPLPGFLDEVAVYERPLSQGEIQGIITTAQSCLTGKPR